MVPGDNAVCIGVPMGQEVVEALLNIGRRFADVKSQGTKVPAVYEDEALLRLGFSKIIFRAE
jgi:hypothetical protein